MYQGDGTYGLLNSRWSLVLAMVHPRLALRSWVLKQARTAALGAPDEARAFDGATPLQLFRLV